MGTHVGSPLSVLCSNNWQNLL